MAIVVVGGSGKDVGKTAVVCGVIAALPELAWTAVKITGHEYEPVARVPNAIGISNRTIWEETTPGADTDTERYLAAGARRALLVMRSCAEVPIEEIRKALGDDRNIIFESNRIVDALKPDVCIAVVDGAVAEVKASFQRLLRVADGLVSVGADANAGWPAGIPRFRLQSLNRLSPEMANWLRARLHAPSQLRIC